jgi:hypothetical protein
MCQSARALIVAPPSTNVNTSAPADDPGWLNVGDRGIYLGNRWVVTAFHVGAGPTNFPGVGSFSAVPGSEVRLQNPAGEGLTALTDLQVYRLSADPGLPWLTLAASTPPIGDAVTLVGDGAAVTMSAMETHWQVTQVGPDQFSWMEVPVGGNAHGYKATTALKLWGTNLVENDESFFPMEQDADHTVAVNAGLGDVVSFFTEFDKAGETDGLATESEAQGLGGDSGSAIFHKANGQWVLAGVTHAISVFEDQPDVGLTAVYGNLTFAADLSVYRDQILAITAIPEVGSFWLVGAVAAMAGAIQCGAWRRRR